MVAYSSAMAAALVCTLVALYYVSRLEPWRRLMFSQGSHSREHTRQNLGISSLAVLFTVPITAAGVASCTAAGGGGAQALAATMVSFWASQCAASLVSEVLKVAVGECRPDYYSRRRSADLRKAGDRQFLADGMKSFPSGHTAIAFSSATFTVLFVHAAFRTHVHGLWSVLLFSVLCILLFGTAFFVGLSRIWANRHFVHDVVAGALIGMTAGAVCHWLMSHSQKRRETRTPAHAVP